jgi:hypothetical protein
MGAHMKTTLDLSDPLFHSAKKIAQESQTTLRALVEEGLRRVLLDYQTQGRSAFKLKDASVGGGKMLQADPRTWQQMEEAHVIDRVSKLSA